MNYQTSSVRFENHMLVYLQVETLHQLFAWASVSKYSIKHRQSQWCANYATLTLAASMTIQVAQLSQGDRAAGWFSYDQKWKTGTGKQ